MKETETLAQPHEVVLVQLKIDPFKILPTDGQPIAIPSVAASQDIDNFSIVDRASNSITIPHTGYYQIGIHLEGSNNTGTSGGSDPRYLQYKKNAGAFQDLGCICLNIEPATNAKLGIFYTLTAYVLLTAGDVITFQISGGLFTQKVNCMQLNIESKKAYLLT